MNLVKLATSYKDVITVCLSLLAFLISCTSLYLSIRNTLLDRVKLIISAKLVSEPMWNTLVRIDVTVLNVGRRSAVLEGLLMHYEHGLTRHDHEAKGITLKEKERVTFSVERNDLIINLEEGEVAQLCDLSILDIEHKKFKVPNSRNLVEKFLNQR